MGSAARADGSDLVVPRRLTEPFPLAWDTTFFLVVFTMIGLLGVTVFRTVT